MARSGYHAAKILAKRNNTIVLNDMNANQDENHIKELEDLGVKVILGSHPDDILDEWRSSTLYFANIANGTAPTDCIAAIYPIYGAICFHRFFVDIHFIFWRLFGI